MYPPVDTVFFQPGPPAAERHFLIVSALVPYKRIELAIDACALAGVPLRIVGDGPDRAPLEAATPPVAQVTFLGPLSGEALRDEYRRACAVLLPGEEDFGIVPVEAQACGRPVVAYGTRRRARDGGGRRHRRPLRRSGRRFDGGGAGARGASSVRRRRVFTRTPSGSRARATSTACAPSSTRRWPPGRHAVVKRHNALLVAFYVVSDALLASVAFLLAFLIRFESGLLPSPRATRRSSSTSTCCRSSPR